MKVLNWLVVAIGLVGCAAPEIGLDGPICLDVSRLTPEQTEAVLGASRRWEPHFEKITVEYNPECENHVENSVWNQEFDGSTKPVTTQLNYTVGWGERTDTQVLIRPGLDYPQWALELALTHELAHVFGLVEHTHDGGLLSARPFLKRSLKLTESDRARVGELYK